MSTIQLTGVRAVAFDLDDTLYPEIEFVRSGFSAVSEWLERRVKCPFDPLVRMHELFETEHRPHIFNEVLRELGIANRPEWVVQMVECYRTHKPRIHLFTDAESTFMRWSGQYRLGLISDGPLASQKGKIQALGLARRLDHIILTDTWGRDFWKPHPRAYLDLQSHWGCDKSSCVYIGDNIAKDFLAPGQLGWQTVQVIRAGNVHQHENQPVGGGPDWKVDSLDDIVLTP